MLYLRKSTKDYGGITAIVFLALAAIQPGAADEVERFEAAAPVEERVSFFRWLEDYSDITEEQRDENLLTQLKRIQLQTGSSYPNVSIGGEYRFKYEHSSNQLFGLKSDQAGDVSLNRFMVHGDARLSKNTRAFLQLGVYEESGRVGGPSPVNKSELDVQQAFIDGNVGQLEARLGRQEIFLDSAKQLGIREGPNQRRSFDALRIQKRSPAGRGVDIFIGKEVVPKRKAFADTSEDGARVWGVYGAKLAQYESDYLDGFYIGVDRTGSAYNQGIGDELRHTLGLRWVGERGAWRYSYEGYLQTGQFAEASILAWGLVTENYYELAKLNWRPTLGVRANIASGDDDPFDNKLGTFDALFPDLNYLTDAGVYTPRNLYELQALLDLKPTDDLEIRVRSNLLWRQNTDDAVYVSPGLPLVPGNDSDERFIGQVLDISGNWSVTPRANLAISYALTAAGGVIDAAGGRDTHHVTTSISFRF